MYPFSQAVVARPLEESHVPLLRLPIELRWEILKYLGSRDLMNISRTCKKYHEDTKNDFVKAHCFLNDYPGYKTKWTAIAASLDDRQIQAWVAQFSGEPGISTSLCRAKGGNDFPALLFYKTSYLMRNARFFKAQEKGCISHDDWVRLGTFSPSGRHVVTVGYDHTAKIWGLDTDGHWTQKGGISHDDWIRSASFSPDGRYVVTASDDHTAKIWLLKTKRSTDASTH